MATPPHDGLVALGLAPSEVATAGLVALAGGDAALAFPVVTVSLAVTAVAAPLLAPLLVDSSIDAGDLIGRFSLVVLVPLVAGLAVRRWSRDDRLETWGGIAATPLLALLVYAALADLGDRSALGGSLVASTLFLAASVALALALRPLLGDLRTGPFVFALRDFAVAAALASQFDTTGAAGPRDLWRVDAAVCRRGVVGARPRTRALTGALDQREHRAACDRHDDA